MSTAVSRPAAAPHAPDARRPKSDPPAPTPEALARAAARAAPAEAVEDERRTVYFFRREVLAGAAGTVFWALVGTADGAAGHCSRCNPLATSCVCQCLSCTLRRGLHVAASASAAPVRPMTLAERVETRWHELQRTAEALELDALHCEEGELCRSNEEVLCECDCLGCMSALDLLIRAEEQVLEEDAGLPA